MQTIHTLKNFLLLAALLVIGLASCNKKNDYLGFTPGTGAPTIASVHTISKSVVDSMLTTTTVTYDTTGTATTTTTPNTNQQVTAFDSTTTAGKGGTYYVIKGTNLGSTTSITFNGVAAYFNRALASNTNLIVSIPATAPFGPDQSGALVVTTLHGSVTYKFTILQPPPAITAISPLAGSAGDTLTVTGTVLDNATAVKFGTVPAKIVGNTSTQIKVLIPEGVVQAYIFVTTPGGTAKSGASFGFKYIIYADGLTPGWGGNGGGYSGYNSTLDFMNTEHVKRGTDAIKVVFGGSYGAIQIGYGGSPVLPVATLGLTAIKFSVYGGTGSTTGDKLQVVINGNYIGVTVSIVAGAYSDFTVPLSTLGSPATITEFVLQSQGAASTIYVDDIGFI